MLKNIYIESTTYQNLIYPRYKSDIQDFSFIPGFEYENCFIAYNRENELWWQKDKKAEMIIADNDLAVFNESDNLVYIADVETYISNSGDVFSHYLNQLLDDEPYFIHMASGTWIGNTNQKERITKMKPSLIDGEEATLTIKKIWGFEPDNATQDDLTTGIIDGFSKKSYIIIVTKDSNDKVIYVPSVEGTPLSEDQIKSIISEFKTTHNGNYPTTEDNLLLVS